MDKVTLNTLRNNEVPEEEIPEDLRYELYLPLRRDALVRPSYRFHLREIESEIWMLWAEVGWILAAPMSSPKGYEHRYLLPKVYRAYPPGVQRAMKVPDRDKWLKKAREIADPKTGRINALKLGFPRDILWRLIEEGFVINPPETRNYYLRRDLRRKAA